MFCGPEIYVYKVLDGSRKTLRTEAALPPHDKLATIYSTELEDHLDQVVMKGSNNYENTKSHHIHSPHCKKNKKTCFLLFDFHLTQEQQQLEQR